MPVLEIEYGLGAANRDGPPGQQLRGPDTLRP